VPTAGKPAVESRQIQRLIMTIERPMFPPRADNVVAFADFNPNRRKPIDGTGEIEQEELSTTGKNSRLRQGRNKAWDMARHKTDYWRARLDWQFALEFAQGRGLGDSDSFPPAADEDRFLLVDAWREAVAHQLLTPAPTLAAVAWKRAKLAGRGFSQLPISAARVKQVIADDEAFLAAHPVRQSNRRTQV
jgi:hypothetical protein